MTNFTVLGFIFDMIVVVLAFTLPRIVARRQEIKITPEQRKRIRENMKKWDEEAKRRGDDNKLLHYWEEV